MGFVLDAAVGVEGGGGVVEVGEEVRVGVEELVGGEGVVEKGEGVGVGGELFEEVVLVGERGEEEGEGGLGVVVDQLVGGGEGIGSGWGGGGGGGERRWAHGFEFSLNYNDG